jgi:hypothetical protein
MHRRLLAIVGAILVVGVAGYYLLLPREEPLPPPTPAVAAPAPVTPAGPPPPTYPVAPSTAPLPELEASDAAFGQAVAQGLGFNALPAWLYPEQMIHRFVATIDSLPRARVSSRLMPVRPVPGLFRVSGTGRELAIAPANEARYQLYVAIAEKADAAKLVDLYLQWYPLFQQAYVELGYPKGYFNDRLVAALDDMLDAPEAPQRAALVQPHVLYEFADPDLEGLSAGQKIMVRMGNDNAARVKKVLRALRARLVERTAGAGHG